jgi:hypothetical protein
MACRGCGQQIRGVVADQDEVDVRPVGDDVGTAAPATPDGDRVARDKVRAIDAETRTMATRTLADWRVRLACVRTEKRTGLGLEPQADDLALLGRVVRCR